jgi:transposase-like protein
MVRAEREQLTGEVEVDETLIGGVEHGAKPGRGVGKSVVAISVEVKQPKGFGRARMRHVPDASDLSLWPFVCDMVGPGSAILTDGWPGYSRSSQCGYIHRKTILSSSEDTAHIAMPGVHGIASLPKRWIPGTHQGSVSDEHLQCYLDEFAFRFNRRTSTSRWFVFRRLLEQAAATGPVTEADVIHGYRW